MAAGVPIGAGQPTFVVAEMSGNHNGSLDRALMIVDAAAATGAQAVKIQTYTADTMTLDVDRPEFRVLASQELWGGRTLHDLYEEAHTPWDWHAPIFEHARAHGLIPFSTPFDATAVEFLESLDVALYKTASAELIDMPLMREVGRTGKPIIMSTGMGTLSEIDAAVRAVRDAGCSELVLLACTASYPAVPQDARLANIALLGELFDVPVGLSDHTRGIGVALAAVTLGAVCVEKHMTLDREDGGVDAEFSMTPAEMTLLVQESESARLAAASSSAFGPTASEEATLRLRRSLYVAEDVRAGEAVGPGNVRAIRPAGGLAPDFYELVQGRIFKTDATRGTPLTWDII